LIELKKQLKKEYQFFITLFVSDMTGNLPEMQNSAFAQLIVVDELILE
jgi:hypothetical protein